MRVRTGVHTALTCTCIHTRVSSQIYRLKTMSLFQYLSFSLIPFPAVTVLDAGVPVVMLYVTGLLHRRPLPSSSQSASESPALWTPS